MRLPARKLSLPDPPERWEALGFAVHDGRLALGGLAVELGTGPALEVEGLRAERPDGLPITQGSGLHIPHAAHPLGATAVDHVVVFTDSLARTEAALVAAGLDLRRRKDAPVPQAFFNLDTTILEVGELSEEAAQRIPWAGDHAAGARFAGLTLVVEDLDAAAERLGPLLGRPRPAVQGDDRRIATVRRDAGMALALALITPRVRTR